MSNQYLNKGFNQTRRHFLKGAAYVSALSVGGLSSVAFAIKGTATLDKSADSLLGDRILGDSDIRIIQETLFDREKVTLINQSGKLQMLDACKPISLYQANGTLVVTVNQNDADAVNGMVLMSPNEQFTFDVKAIGIELSEAIDMPTLTNLAENELQITSQHSVFNRIVPVELV
ncbi:MAG: twin-arginine translocation signal domain-containing protein [Cocleimonas sp.]